MEITAAKTSNVHRGAQFPAAVNIGRQWTDWAGCLLFLGVASDMLAHSPKIGILLLPSVLHELIVAASFLLRRPIARQAKGWQPRVAAYSGTFLVLVFIRFSSAFRPDWVALSYNPALNAAGMTLWLLGTLFALYAVWYFRHAFSLVPQARVLVTSGPFRIARHPIYLGYLFQYVGIWFTHMTVQFAFVLVLWAAIMCLRIWYEETLLLAAFPEYAEYQKQVSAIHPRFPRQVVYRYAQSSREIEPCKRHSGDHSLRPAA